MTTILFLGANSSEQTRLELAEETRAIDQRLVAARYRKRFTLKHAPAVRVDDLQGLLLRHEPNIVHFSGHGSKDGEIFLIEGDDGAATAVSVEALANLFRLVSDTVKCVVLNACYSEPQARAIASHIEYVIGMSNAIKDKAAIAFSSGFYEALGHGKEIPRAFDFGCSFIDIKKLEQSSVPKLLSRSSLLKESAIQASP